MMRIFVLLVLLFSTCSAHLMKEQYRKIREAEENSSEQTSEEVLARAVGFNDEEVQAVLNANRNRGAVDSMDLMDSLCRVLGKSKKLVFVEKDPNDPAGTSEADWNKHNKDAPASVKMSYWFGATGSKEYVLNSQRNGCVIMYQKYEEILAEHNALLNKNN